MDNDAHMGMRDSGTREMDEVGRYVRYPAENITYFSCCVKYTVQTVRFSLP